MPAGRSLHQSSVFLSKLDLGRKTGTFWTTDMQADRDGKIPYRGLSRSASQPKQCSWVNLQDGPRIGAGRSWPGGRIPPTERELLLWAWLVASPHAAQAQDTLGEASARETDFRHCAADPKLCASNPNNRQFRLVQCLQSTQAQRRNTTT